jgi:NADH-quinone oxidoreductase subunit M
VALWGFNKWVAALAVLGIVLSAIYGLRAVARIFYGKPMGQMLMKGDLGWATRWPAILLFIPLLGLGFYPKPLTDLIDGALSTKNPPLEFILPRKVEPKIQPLTTLLEEPTQP